MKIAVLLFSFTLSGENPKIALLFFYRFRQAGRVGKIREEREFRGENGKRGTEILRRYILAGQDRPETAQNQKIAKSGNPKIRKTATIYTYTYGLLYPFIAFYTLL